MLGAWGACLGGVGASFRTVRALDQDEPRPADWQVTLGDPQTFVWDMGVEVAAGAGAARGLTATFPVPIDWPEQSVEVMDERVADYLSLLLRFDVQIVYQALSGGGVQSSEFPIIVRVDYMDGSGATRTWTHGFYAQNDAGYNVVDGEKIPLDTVYRFETDLTSVLVDPQLIYNIRFYASGWDWEVYVSEVELIAQ